MSDRADKVAHIRVAGAAAAVGQRHKCLQYTGLAQTVVIGTDEAVCVVQMGGVFGEFRSETCGDFGQVDFGWPGLIPIEFWSCTDNR